MKAVVYYRGIEINKSLNASKDYDVVKVFFDVKGRDQQAEMMVYLTENRDIHMIIVPTITVFAPSAFTLSIMHSLKDMKVNLYAVRENVYILDDNFNHTLQGLTFINLISAEVAENTRRAKEGVINKKKSQLMDLFLNGGITNEKFEYEMKKLNE